MRLLSLEAFLGRNTGQVITYTVSKNMLLGVNYWRKRSLVALLERNIGRTFVCLVATRCFLGRNIVL